MTRRSRAVIVAMLVVFVVTGARAGGKDDLTAAEERFNRADFMSALSIVNRITAEGSLSKDDERDAFALKARCEAELGNRADALDAFCRVIAIEPGWRPDKTLYTPGELAIFEEALEMCGDGGSTDSKRADGGSGKKWWFLGGGVVVAAVAILLAGGGGDGGETPASDLPGFPDPPVE